MASSEMYGPYELTNEKIDLVVTRKSPGKYALGRSPFSVLYVGRADDDLNARLKQWVNKYTHFKFTYATSPKDAFEKECKNYHNFKPTDNKVHPDRPDGTDWKCPVCDIFK